jgi:hypothetical protein
MCPIALRRLKGKVDGDCAEAVEDRNFLWKVPEKLRRKSTTEARRHRGASKKPDIAHVLLFSPWLGVSVVEIKKERHGRSCA